MISVSENIQKTSLIFFAVIGFFHFISGSIYYQNPTNLGAIIYRSSFLPLVICALIYAGTNIKINIYKITGRESGMADKIIIFAVLSLSIGITLLFFLFPDR